MDNPFQKLNSKNRNQAVKLTVGGDVQASHGTYLSRLADEQLFQACLANEFVYILASRQIGKSSLKNEIAKRLQLEGVKVARIDLNRIGQNIEQAEIWYFSLMDEIARSLKLQTDLEVWWDKQPRLLTLAQRFLRFLDEVVLTEISDQIVIFIDEIDVMLGFTFTNDFFATIRTVHNDRAQYPAYQRLSFVLLGVATPDELISDNSRTPFNIGQAVIVRDFTPDECTPLHLAIETKHPGQGLNHLQQIFAWTHGHPYLTQKLCAAVADSPGTGESTLVDNLVHSIFLREDERPETNLQFVQSRILRDRYAPQMLQTYKKILQNETVIDEEKSPIINKLKLYGLVVSEKGRLQVRNKLYKHAFDLSWVKRNTQFEWSRTKVSAVVIGILVIGAVIGGSVVTNWLKRPIPMTGEFNIAVAEFQLITKEGNIPKQLTNIAQLFYYRLVYEFKRVVDAKQIIFEVRSPETIGSVSCDSSEMKKLARTLNADIVISGNVNTVSSEVYLTPCFWVNTKYNENFQEIMDQFRLGSPVKISEIEFSTLNHELFSRLQALILITLGNAYYADYKDYKEALKYFKKAEALDGWDENEGKEVLYTLIGETALKLGPLEDTASKLELLADAENYCNKALHLNTEYSRAYICLGNVLIQKALQGSISPQEINVDLLEQAFKIFSHALIAQDQPNKTNVSFEVHYGLGLVYLYKEYVTTPDPSCDSFMTARNQFEAIISEYEDNPDQAWKERVQEIVSRTYNFQGWIYILCSEEQRAIPFYQKALELTQTIERKLFYAAQLSNINIIVGNEKDAMQWYNEANEIYQEIIKNEAQSSAARGEYEDMIKELRLKIANLLLNK